MKLSLTRRLIRGAFLCTLGGALACATTASQSSSSAPAAEMASSEEAPAQDAATSSAEVSNTPDGQATPTSDSPDSDGGLESSHHGSEAPKGEPAADAKVAGDAPQGS